MILLHNGHETVAKTDSDHVQTAEGPARTRTVRIERQDGRHAIPRETVAAASAYFADAMDQGG